MYKQLILKLKQFNIQEKAKRAFRSYDELRKLKKYLKPCLIELPPLLMATGHLLTNNVVWALPGALLGVYGGYEYIRKEYKKGRRK